MHLRFALACAMPVDAAERRVQEVARRRRQKGEREPLLQLDVAHFGGRHVRDEAGDAVVKLQADVIDKLMPAFLPLVYTLTMFWLVRRGWSPLRLIGITVLLGVVGKFCHFL